MRTALAVVVVMGVSGAAHAAEPEGAVACPAFKEGWAAVLQRLEPGRPPLAFTAAPVLAGPGERVEALDGIAAGLICADGTLRHVELRQGRDGDAGSTALVRAAAGILMTFDGEITPAQATGLVEALGAEARPDRDAVSAWGAYELTFGRPGAGAEFAADLQRN